MANDLGITIEQVRASYEGNIPDDDSVWVSGKIDEAVRELLALIPTLQDRVDSGVVNRDFVADKVVAAVLRVVRNPKGIIDEGEGDYSIRLDKLVASGDIWYPEKDLIKLGWVKPSARNRPRTIFSNVSRGFGIPL